MLAKNHGSESADVFSKDQVVQRLLSFLSQFDQRPEFSLLPSETEQILLLDLLQSGQLPSLSKHERKL